MSEGSQKIEELRDERDRMKADLQAERRKVADLEWIRSEWNRRVKLISEDFIADSMEVAPLALCEMRQALEELLNDEGRVGLKPTPAPDSRG